jgi:2-keto-3-deoxy-L-rhamnonate aldolase RhmA
VLVACNLEGEGSLENLEEIVKVDGIDIIKSGRGDLSLALGVPGEDYHPKVLEAEKRIVGAALDAGKQVCLHNSNTDEGIERALRWIEQGVRILETDSDYQVLLRDYGTTLKRLRQE